MDEFEIDTGNTTSRNYGLGAVAAAAAVGAGVALLLATERGAEARRQVARQIRDLELGERAERLGHAASERFSEVRGRGSRKKGKGRGRKRTRRQVVTTEGNGSAMSALLGTVAGAAIAALLTPQGGRETRQWIGHTFDDLRSNASLRWREHRAARKPEVDREVERLNGGVG